MSPRRAALFSTMSIAPLKWIWRWDRRQAARAKLQAELTEKAAANG